MEDMNVWMIVGSLVVALSIPMVLGFKWLFAKLEAVVSASETKLDDQVFYAVKKALHEATAEAVEPSPDGK